MKRTLQGLAIGLACGAITLGCLALSFPTEQAGCFPRNSRPVSCSGSGFYIGQGLVLTNQHVAEMVSEESRFLLPSWEYLWNSLDVDIQKVIYLNRDIDLGIVKLQPSMLNLVGLGTPCLSTHPVKQGDVLRVSGNAHGKYPPVSAALVVSDALPRMRLDLDPGDGNPYSAMTIVTTISADQANLVGHGSSGGPVLNDDGELVGLVWTGHRLEDGSAEVWITPVSAWLSQLQAAEIPKDDLQAILDAKCTR